MPLAPASPEERNLMILEDAKPLAVLCNKDYQDNLKQMTNGSLPVLAAEDVDPNASIDNVVLPRKTMVTDVAYMIYTSGTTGT